MEAVELQTELLKHRQACGGHQRPLYRPIFLFLFFLRLLQRIPVPPPPTAWGGQTGDVHPVFSLPGIDHVPAGV